MELATVTLDYILDPSVPLWWPGLAGRLIDDMKRNRGVELTNYSTSEWLTRGAISPQQLIAVRNTYRSNSQTRVEVLSPAMQPRNGNSGCRFWEIDELAQSAALDLLALALNEIAVIPDLADTVEQLARRIHLLVPNDDAYDINYSEPELPFSVFVSIPRQPSEQMRWRVAEAIVHEVGHLQLSLVERIVPLIGSPKELYYSPWRKAPRSVSGVLHGLYVFGMIAEWTIRSSVPASYTRRRLADIAREVKQIDDFPESSGLTYTGAALARNAIARVTAAASSTVSAGSENEEAL